MPATLRHLALQAGFAMAAAALLNPGSAIAEPRATLSTTIPAIVASHTAAFAAAPSPDQVIHLVVSLPMRDPAGLDAFLHDIYDPASPHFHQYLSVTDFTARFGATTSDESQLAAFFTSSGLTVAKRSANRMLIDVDGRVADIERVFHVQLGLYRHPTENRLFMSPDRPPTLDVAVPVQEVIGLDDFVLPYSKLVHANGRIGGVRTGSGPGGQFTGNDMRNAYYPGGKLTGAGQSVALFEFVGYNVADVTRFFASGYGPANSVPIVAVKTDARATTCTKCDDSEQVLDIEYAISMAPGLSSVRVYVGANAEDILNAIATDNISKIVSSSWGWKEHFASDDAIFKEFAAQGQTNLTASGDYSSLQASGPWPEEDANIVAVGGTDVATNTAGGAWSGETGWSGSAGGPSVDKTIKIEPYQAAVITAASGASTTLRNVPDIALNANTDMEICADGSCNGGNGGTSFASPMWAGVIAMANQQAVAAGKPVVGFINPAVYALAAGKSYGTSFHDVVAGKSGKYTAGKGYDLVTGLGSPKGQAFIDALVNQ